MPHEGERCEQGSTVGAVLECVAAAEEAAGVVVSLADSTGVQ